MKLTKNFSLSELVHPDILDLVGDDAVKLLHPELAPTLQAIRDKFGKIMINGDIWGKKFTLSGLRPKNTTVGAKRSKHKIGTAADCKFETVTPIEVQNYIILHQDEFPNITRIENALVTKTWLHVETGERTGSIKVFNP